MVAGFIHKHQYLKWDEESKELEINNLSLINEKKISTFLKSGFNSMLTFKLFYDNMISYENNSNFLFDFSYTFIEKIFVVSISFLHFISD